MTAQTGPGATSVGPAHPLGQPQPERSGGPSAARIGGPGGTGRLRWILASSVVAIVVTISAAAFSALAAGPGPSSLTAFVPSDATVYVELRADLPGDQGIKLADFLAKFPGFADRSTLENKLDEALDQLFSRAGARFTYSRDVKPWFGGEVAIVSRTGRDLGSRAYAPLVLISAKDSAAGLAFIITAFGDAPTSSQVIGGLPFTVVSGDTGPVAFGASGSTILVGRPADVESALDATSTGAGLAQTPDFQKAVAALPGDHLAFGYVAFREVYEQLLERLGTGLPIAPGSSSSSPFASLPPDFIARFIPAWLAFDARVQSDALIVDVAFAKTEYSLPSPSVSKLASRLPGSTFVEFEVRDTGAFVKSILDLYRTIPSLTSELDRLDQEATRVLGTNLVGLTAWMDDAAFVVSRNGLSFSGGLVIETIDQAAAIALQQRIMGLLGPVLQEQNVVVTQEPFGNGSITLISPASAGPVPGLPNGKLEVAVTIQDNLLVIGLGSDFVKSVLQPTAGSTLADQATYKLTMDKAGLSNSGQLYVDVENVVDLVELLLPLVNPSASQEFATEIKPFVDPLRGAAYSGTEMSDTVVARFVLTVGEGAAIP